MGKTTSVQEHYTYVADDGSESGSTLGTTDTNWTQLVDTVFRVRFTVSETSGGSFASALELRYDTGGGYNLVTGTSPIQTAASAETSWTITDGDATTNRLTGSGSFTAGEYSEDGNTGSISLSSQFTNVEFCLSIDSAQVNNLDTISLRVYQSGGTTLSTYSATPTITVSEPVVYNADFTAGSYTLTGQGPGVAAIRNVDMTAGALALTGQNPDAQKQYGADLLAGSYTLAGQNPDAQVTHTADFTAGTLTLTGQDPDAQKQYGADLTAGSFALSGQDPEAQVTHTADLTTGSFALSGQDPDAQKQYGVDTTAGSFTLTGPTIDAQLTHAADFTTGSYTLAGQDPDVAKTVVYTADLLVGSYTSTGQDQDVTAIRNVDMAAGSYVLAGQDPDVTAIRNVDMAPGSYTLSAADPFVAAFYVLKPAVVPYDQVFYMTGNTVEVAYGTLWIPPGDLTISLNANPTPADSLTANPTPNASVKANPTPAENLLVNM